MILYYHHSILISNINTTIYFITKSKHIIQRYYYNFDLLSKFC